MLPLHNFYSVADVSQLVGEDHAFLFCHLLFADELHHLLEVSIHVHFLQALLRSLCQVLHVLHDLKRVFETLVVKYIRFPPHFLCVLRHDSWSPLRRFLGFGVYSVEVD